MVLGACTQAMPFSDRSTTTLPVSSPPEITRPPMSNFLRPAAMRSYLAGSGIFLTATRECPASEPASAALICSRRETSR